MADRNANIIVTLRSNADAETRKLAASFREMIQQARDAGASQAQAERQALSHAAALARLASASGQAAQGEKVLVAALSQVNRESTAAIRTQTQLASIQGRGASLAQQFGGALKGNLLGVLGPAALATAAIGAVTGAIAGGVGAAQEALALRETRNSLRAVAGDARGYAEALSIARQQQLLFGGSLRENIDGVQGLTIVAKESGAELRQLIDLSQRLNLKSPEQGIGGARVAITEALSGNTRSLAARFEIPKDKLKELGDTSLPVAQRLATIDAYLAKIGITSDAVAGKVDQDAAAFRRLNAEAEQLQLNIGDGLASAFSRSATGLSRLIGLINDNPQAIAELRALNGGTGDGVVSEADLTKAKQDVGRREAIRLTRNNSETFLGIDTERTAEQAAAIARARDLLTEFIAAGGGAAETARGLAGQFQNNTLTTDQLVAELERLKNTSDSLASPFSAAASAATATTNAFAEQTVELLQNNAEAERQRRVMELIAAQAARVRAGLIIEAEGAAILRGELGDAADEALRLALQLDGTKAAIDLQKTAPLDASTRAFIAKGKAIEDQAAATKALEDRTRSVGTLAERQALAQQKLDEARKKFGKDSAEAISAETDVIRLRQEAERLAEREGKTRIKDGQTALNLEERIADSKEKQLRSAIDARLALNDDAKQDILDADRLRRNQIAASRATDPRIRALAALDSERIPLEDARRALDIREQLATAGGQVVNGKIIQGQRGADGLPALPGGGAGLPALPGLPSLPGGGGPLTFIHHIYLEDQEIVARVVTELSDGAQQAINAGAGR